MSYAVIAAAMAVWAIMPSGDAVSGVVGLICLTCVFTLIPIAVRLHDLDITGWWVAVFVAVYAFAMAPRDPTVTSLGSVALFVAVVWLGSKKRGPGRQSARCCPRLSERNRFATCYRPLGLEVDGFPSGTSTSFLKKVRMRSRCEAAMS